MKGKDIGICLLLTFAVTCVIAWLFYRNVWGMLLFFPVFPILILRRKEQQCELRKKRLAGQFKECVRMITASLYAGYSVENAFRQAEHDLAHLMGAKAEMCRELAQMNRQIRLNIPVEQLMEGLAERSGVEEIFAFGQVFGYARRNGSNFLLILKNTTEKMEERMELEEEIQTFLTGKKLEQRIMNVIPLGILLFVDLSSPGFLDMMYTTMAGRVIMTCFLFIYGGAFLLSEHMINIRV